MGTIIRKKIKNITYYYYVESKRINGKPKLVNQKLLGNAEKLLAKATFIDSMQEKALYSCEHDFGAVTLIYDIARRLGLVDVINKHVPKRNQGASIGEYILTEVINRIVAPTSAVNIPEWYENTYLVRLMGHSPKTFTAQNFWNNTRIDAETIQDIENDILKTIANVYDVDLSNIIYDATNFFTYIDTKQESEPAKRGHSKEKRNDLKIVGLSLMVSPDFSIPLLHETYPSNTNDSKQFSRMMKSLKERYELITCKKADVTVVFDRGNNSEDNIAFLEMEQNGNPLLTFAKSDASLLALEEKELGKTVLFTNRLDYTNEDIIKAYRSAWNVESNFKQMKNTEHLTVRPIFHWTDEKIRIHIFTCVLAYRLSCLLRKELSEKGIDISINQMIDEAAKIKAVSTFFDVGGKTKKVETFTKGSELSQKIMDAFSLKEKYS